MNSGTLARLAGSLTDRSIRRELGATGMETVNRGGFGNDDRIRVKVLPSTAPQSEIRAMTGAR